MKTYVHIINSCYFSWLFQHPRHVPSVRGMFGARAAGLHPLKEDLQEALVVHGKSHRNYGKIHGIPWKWENSLEKIHGNEHPNIRIIVYSYLSHYDWSYKQHISLRQVELQAGCDCLEAHISPILVMKHGSGKPRNHGKSYSNRLNNIK